MTKTTDQPTTPVDVLALLLLGAALGFTVALAVLGTVRIDDRHVFEMIVMCADQDLPAVPGQTGIVTGGV